MLKRLTLFILVAFSLTGCHCGGGARSFSYSLRQPQNDREFSTLHTMPDGALLVLTKRLEQPKQIWTIRRIAAWDTSQPREDDLDVDVGPNDEPLDWADQYDRWDRNVQLLMDPGGNYLVVRLSQNADTWNFIYNQITPGVYIMPISVLNIIDLHGFKLLRRVVVTDPMLASGDMGFSPTGALIVSGVQGYKSATIDGKVTNTGYYAVETLALPDLKPETVCSYTLINKLFLAQTDTTPEEKACRPKLAPLGFASLDDVRKSLNFLGMREYSADYSMKVPPQSPWGCQFEDLSGDLKYTLLDCDESRIAVTLLPWYYRGFRVFKLADGTQIMDLKVPHGHLWYDRPQFSGVVATSRGVTYLVLLRDGAELEGYRAP
ncbi:MAG: hypothetical protein WCD12_12420 [Candidatus Binatus sp.]|uniref:hypothetical protein n=1 Tax=Candidatus Binatus sp. TaxID=2811406 RepID=UPI003C760207